MTTTTDDLSLYEHDTEPLTAAELKAIATYRSLTVGMADALETVDYTPDPDVPRGLAPHYAKRTVRADFDTLAAWYEALDLLRSDLADGRNHMSAAGSRYIAEQCRTWYRRLHLVRREACRWAFGTGGPQPDVDSGILTFFASPGIELDGTIAAESR